MTTTLKKLPAILLAVIVAAALAVGIGAALQPAYADDAASNAYYLIVMPAEEGNDTVLPGQKLLMKATVYDSEGEDVTGQVVIKDPQWTVAEGSEYAAYEPASADGKDAYLVFNGTPADVESEELYASLQLTAEISGQVQTSNAYPVTCASSYYRLVGTDLDPYLAKGKSQEVTAQVMNYTVENPEGAPVNDVNFTWEVYDQEKVGIDPVTATGDAITSTITRNSDEWDFIVLHAAFNDPQGEEQNEYKTYYFNERSSDLNDYEVVVDPDSEDWKTVIPEGTTYKPAVTVKNGDFELPEDAYDIVVQRYKGYDEEAGEDVYEDYCKNWDKELAVAEKDAVDQDGNPIGGTNTFKIIAKAKAGSGYDGTTEDFPGYVFLYSDKTLNDYAADVKMLDAEGQEVEWKLVDVYPYLRYETNPGVALTPVVTLNGKELKAGTDCELTFTNTSTMDTTNTFPTEGGEYILTVTGKGDYYGKADDTWIKVGETNTLTVKTKAMKAKTKKNTTKKAIKVKTNGEVFMYPVAVNGSYKAKIMNKISVKPNGKVTVKKGLKKGTYKLQVLVSTPGDETYLSAEKYVTVKIKVK